MKRFRLNFCLLIVAVMGFAAVTAIMFRDGRWAEGCLTVLALAVCVAGLFSLIRKLVNVMSTFVSAMEANDTTMGFDFGRDDPAFRRMTASMNRIVELYRTNSVQLETSKLYYDRILKIMTHEMRNAVTPIIALASDMSSHQERYGEAERREALEIIREQSEGIRHFLDSYYTLTHLPAPKTEETDATAFFSKIRNIATIEAANRNLDPGICRMTVARGMTLNIDPALMSQALVNLIRNALDAVAERENPQVDIKVSSGADGRPYIVISDNGAGIPPEVADNLFQPFFTTKPGGSGVGLCLSRQIVRRHGGDIRPVSKPGGTGAAFAITL